jgi:hypothetical protein
MADRVMNGVRTGTVQEGYARLPEDLLHDLLGGSAPLVEEVERLLGSNLDKQSELRAALDDLGWVRRLRDRDKGTMSGIDGGFAIERTSSVDMSLAVAVGVEGLSETTAHWEGTQYEWWTRVSKHDLEAERLCRGVMVAQELAILRDAPHTYRILDGSHLTPVIQLNSALTVRSAELTDEAARVWERLGTIEALSGMSTDHRIVGMPKYDSSTYIAKELQRRVGFDVPGDDKLLMSLLLHPDEFIFPRRVLAEPWTQLHFDSASPKHEHIARALEEAIQPLRDLNLSFTYYKPDEMSPAFRIEVKGDQPIEALEGFLTTLKYQMTGPFVREPYPQYLADVMAKSVGLGLSALQSSVQLALSRADRPELAELLLSSYRTEGV